MSERSAVQNPMLKYAQEIGWEYVKPDDALAMRGGDTGLYFSGVLEAQLVRLNPGVVDLSLTPDILRRLNLLHASIEGNREAHSWLRGEQGWSSRSRSQPPIGGAFCHQNRDFLAHLND